MTRASHDGEIFPSERDDFQARDELEVSDIERGYIEAEMEGRGPDHQILEGDGDAFGCLLTLDLSGKLRDLQRHRMHHHVPA
jgi:hypothetical protein